MVDKFYMLSYETPREENVNNSDARCCHANMLIVNMSTKATSYIGVTENVNNSDARCLIVVVTIYRNKSIHMEYLKQLLLSHFQNVDTKI